MVVVVKRDALHIDYYSCYRPKSKNARTVRMDEVFTLIYDCDHQEVFAMSTDDIRQVLRYILKNPSLQL